LNGDKVDETGVKHTIGAVACATALVASLAACGGGDNTAALPSHTAGSSPSTTATSPPATTPPTAAGAVALPASSTYMYGALEVIVNLPTDVPSASRPSMRVFSEFLSPTS
jgi:hypothetical protein